MASNQKNLKKGKYVFLVCYFQFIINISIFNEKMLISFILTVPINIFIWNSLKILPSSLFIYGVVYTCA
jgi:hypothetical protein